jgi:methionyl-tRNA formyltransferase
MSETVPRKRVIVMGKGALALRVARWFAGRTEYALERIVPVVPEPAWADSLIEWAESAGIAYVETGSYRDIPSIDTPSWRVDLLFSVFYDRILPGWFIARCGRILNIHNAPLPRYRGVSPINWALKNGERKHGVTIHEITTEVDAGPIVSQVEFSIYPEFDEVIDVYARALEFGWALFEQTMPILDKITAQPQDEKLATMYSRHQDALLGDRRDFTRSASLHEPTSSRE